MWWRALFHLRLWGGSTWRWLAAVPMMVLSAYFFFLWLGYVMTIRKIIVENRGDVEPIEILAWFTGEDGRGLPLLGCRPGPYRPRGLPARRRCAIRANWEVGSAASISPGVDYFCAWNPRLHPSCIVCVVNFGFAPSAV